MPQPTIVDKGNVRWITIDRPEIANALRLEDLETLKTAVTDAGEEIRAIVITGSGNRAFSAGMHTETFANNSPEQARTNISAVRDCVGAFRLSPLPTIAVINGASIGAAFEIALACDIRIAHPQARFGLPEVKLGIPSVVDAALLHHHVGLSKAKEIILTGDLYSAEELSSCGMINKMVAPEELSSATEAMLEKLTSPTREVMASQKALFEAWLNTGLQDGIETSVDAFSDIFNHQATLDAIENYMPKVAR